jgi:hypothetical protein
MQAYSINKKSVVLSIFFSLILPISGTLLIGAIYIFFTDNVNFLVWLKEGKTMFYVTIIILLAAIPANYIFLEYLFFNYRTVVRIDIDKNEISIHHKKRQYSNSPESLKSCTIFKETKGWAFFPCSNFSFAHLVFTDGYEVYITCLLEWDLNFIYDKTTFVEKRSVFPSILIYQVLHN